MKGDETAGLVLSRSGQIFCSHRAALIVIKPAVVYQKTCHKRDVITEGPGLSFNLLSLQNRDLRF